MDKQKIFHIIIPYKNHPDLKPTIRIFSFILLIIIIPVSSYGKQPVDYTGGKYKALDLGMHYFSFSAGAGVWYKSTQDGMDRHFIPKSVMIEYGRTLVPLSVITGAYIHTTFIQERFILNPNNFLLGVRYSPLTGTGKGDKLSLYGIAGFNMCYSRFTENLYPGIINYEYKVEKKTGVGIGTGAGIGYRFKSWELGSSLMFFTGNAGFFAGHFEEMTFSTGSLQLHLMLSYRLVLDKNRRNCPVYRKNYFTL